MIRFFRRRRWDEERARELDAYLEQETADNIARGMSAAEARGAAQRKLGNTATIREEIYSMNSLGIIETLWQDVSYAIRVLRKSPGFTLVALLSLALGIGATTAIFSAVYGVLVAPYIYGRPDPRGAPQIVDLSRPQGRNFSVHRMRDLAELKKLPAFGQVMATRPENRVLAGDRAPENFQAINVTANAFEFLEVRPILGRTILPSDIRPDGSPESVIVLTYKAWVRLFDASPDALGKTLMIDDQRYSVIGVMPARFGWWTDQGGWVPMMEDVRDNRQVAAIMRLATGVSPRAAEEQLQALHMRLAQEHPGEFPKNGFTTRLNNYMDITAVSGEMRASLRLLFGAVGFLLLIACANVANLQLARGTARAHEIAVRMSVGAGRGRVFRQLLTESVTLAAAGGILGVAMALVITKAILLLMPQYYVPNESRIEVNVYVLLFSAAVSVLTGIVFGLAPALQCSRPGLVDALKDASRTLTGGGGGGRLRRALVTAEIALSVVLLMGASLTLRGFIKMQNLDIGFRADRVLMIGLQLPVKRYTNYQQRIAFADRVLSSVSGLPGVQFAAIGNGALPFGGTRSTYTIEGQPKEPSRTLLVGLISADYPQTLGIPLRAGRPMNAQEVAHAEPVALINETAAKLWPAGTNPVGARVRLDSIEKPAGNVFTPPAGNGVFTVVGVIGDTRNDGLREPPAPAAYVPYTCLAPPVRNVALRTEGPPMQLLNALRERVRAIDREMPLTRPITMEEIVGFETVQPRFNMALFTFFGLLGLALATVGIYSMLSYIVAQRTHEIGIRMALGADRRNVLELILAMGGKLALIGLGIGLVGSIALAKLLRSEIFLVPETDAVALDGVVSVVCVAVLLACFVPARRAARLDPMNALRHE